MVSSSSIDFLSVSPTGSNFLRFPLQSERMGFNKDLRRHPLTVTALQPPSQTSVVELKAPSNSHTLAPLRWHLTWHELLRSLLSFYSFSVWSCVCSLVLGCFVCVCSRLGLLGCSGCDILKRKSILNSAYLEYSAQGSKKAIRLQFRPEISVKIHQCYIYGCYRWCNKTNLTNYIQIKGDHKRMSFILCFINPATQWFIYVNAVFLLLRCYM